MQGGNRSELNPGKYTQHHVGETDLDFQEFQGVGGEVILAARDLLHEVTPGPEPAYLVLGEIRCLNRLTQVRIQGRGRGLFLAGLLGGFLGGFLGGLFAGLLLAGLLLALVPINRLVCRGASASDKQPHTQEKKRGPHGGPPVPAEW